MGQKQFLGNKTSYGGFQYKWKPERGVSKKVRVEKEKFFQMSSFPVRYFQVDFTAAKMWIKQNRDDPITNQTTKEIEFRKIKNVYKSYNTDFKKPWIYNDRFQYHCYVRTRVY